jgi:hypothetical protein
MRLFPRVSVAVDAKGLHLKRQPWHFMHPPLLIPWTAIADIETMSSADFGPANLRAELGYPNRRCAARWSRARWAN